MLLVLTGKTAVLLGKRMYQTSQKINGSLVFTNNVKGLHQFTKNLKAQKLFVKR